MTVAQVQQRVLSVRRVPGFVWASFQRIPPLVIDGLIALAVAAVSFASNYATGGSTHAGPLAWLSYGLVAAMVLPLIFRRRWPLETLLAIAALAIVYQLVESPDLLDNEQFWPLGFGLYAVSAYERRRRGWIVAVVAAEAFFAVRAFDGTNSISTFGDSVWLLLFLAAGAIVRGRRERAQLAERQREADARRMVDEERLRIARELHDVVAHSIAAISVQAGMAAHVFDAQPEQARAALGDIRAVSRNALHELRATLGVLRSASDTDEGRLPAPQLDQLDELIARTEAAGIHVALSTSGQARDLPPAIELTAYRIVQEALTNVVRHAGPAARAAVAISYRPDMVELRVTDTGPPNDTPHPPVATGSGLGLIGMRERVASVGGELATGPRRDGGFEVRACLPTLPASPEVPA